MVAGDGVEQEAGRALVVDDNEMNRDILARRLSRQGLAVVTANNGKEALATLHREPFDIVLLDIMMPEMDGYEVLRRMREDEELRTVRVIMITAIDAVDSVVKCIELGADDYLTKPFNPVLLKARIESSLARKRLEDATRLYAQALERDLEIGRTIQAGFLPDEVPVVDGWDIAAGFHAARQVAGDFYDFFRVDGGLGIVIADVCDKGVGAALFMALFRSLIRATATQADMPATGEAVAAPLTGEGTLRRTIHVTNDYIARTHGRANMFATVFFAVLDPVSGALDYANCGQEAPIILSPAGTDTRLTPTGPAVGMLPDLDFAVRRVSLPPGTTLVAFTDGVTEARAVDGAFFGEQRLRAALQPPPRSAATAVTSIEAALFAHVQGAPQSDDVTLLAVHRSP
jgi:sigma-B regulation protein RsbU (phosphoserine phosphatase)